MPVSVGDKKLAPVDVQIGVKGHRLGKGGYDQERGNPETQRPFALSRHIETHREILKAGLEEGDGPLYLLADPDPYRRAPGIERRKIPQAIGKQR